MFELVLFALEFEYGDRVCVCRVGRSCYDAFRQIGLVSGVSRLRKKDLFWFLIISQSLSVKIALLIKWWSQSVHLAEVLRKTALEASLEIFFMLLRCTLMAWIVPICSRMPFVALGMGERRWARMAVRYLLSRRTTSLCPSEDVLNCGIAV